MSKGIDYGRGTNVNRDPETGIRYGIIPLHRLGEFAIESFEAEYAHVCPACGEEWEAADYADAPPNKAWCAHCDTLVREDVCYSEDPIGHSLVDPEASGMLDSGNDVWIFKSPYYTRAAFCSPCAPGACYLTSPCEDGERAYCLGPEWFDADNPMPYDCWRVDTDEPVT